MKKILKIIKSLTILLILATNAISYSQEKIEKWKIFELKFEYETEGNPFQDVRMSAKFSNENEELIVNGFYDGNNTFKIRFMPNKTGIWKYEVNSNIHDINGFQGSIDCIKPTENNRGLVEVNNSFHFKYSEGGHYFPFGTTTYAWVHMKENLQELSLKTFEEADFNKVRMCAFPKNYDFVKEEPNYYPFELKKVEVDSEGEKKFTWDFDKFNPKFFQHLENRILDLDKIGVQADLILFHPYDDGRWGFDSMPEEVNLRYIEYLLSRLGSYKNVWWSLANEWDYVVAKTVDDWDVLIDAVVKNDPYNHLVSIHGSTATYYNYLKPELTHVSIQDEAPVLTSYSSATLRRIFKKPIVLDEVGYEGNLSRRWGRLSPEKMMHFVWNGVISGTYVTHGEVYKFEKEGDTFFWADGGNLKGESWKRIKFLKGIMESMSGPLFMADISRDLQTASTGNGEYLVYFGEEMSDSWLFNLPKKNGELEKLKVGQKFKVEVIDAWDMTITTYPGIFETVNVNDNYRLFDQNLKEVRLPNKPYVALRITNVE